MNEEIKILSNKKSIKVDVNFKNGNNSISIDENLTKYYSDLAKKWAISSEIVNNDDFSAKYYSSLAKKNIDDATASIVEEVENNLTQAKKQVELVKEQADILEQKGNEQVNLAKEQVQILEQKATEQVNLAKEQVNLAKEQVQKIYELSDELSANYSDVELSNINSVGKNVIKNIVQESCISLPIGAIIPLFCSNDYVPKGLLSCDGNEFLKSNLPDFWENYLKSSKVLTCTYEEYDQDVLTYGRCAKFAVNLVEEKFKLPLLNDGTFIQQALSADRLGVSYKAGVPNILGALNWGNTGLKSSSGAFKISNANNDWNTGNNKYTGHRDASFDASLSNSIYGNSDTVQPEAVSLRFFVVISNSTINQSEMDWSTWASNLQSKLNTDFSNSTKPYVIDTYSNETSWYRVWSDNWCEQGGTVQGANIFTLELLKPYKDNNYVGFVVGRYGTAPAYTYNCHFCPVSNSSATIYLGTSSSAVGQWRAEGFV